MFWRLISAAIVLFWAVMTGLVIRDAYFPDSSQFAELPPKLVFDQFLDQAGSFNNQLLLYHEKEKLGHTNFSITRQKDTEPAVYVIGAGGSIVPPGDAAPAGATSFNLTAELEDGRIWRSVALQTRTSALQTVGNVSWKAGDGFPKV